MTEDQTLLHVEAVARQHLLDAGWTPTWPALATTMIDTAIGEKQAIARIEDWRSDRYVQDGFSISGEYWSEQGNVLAPHRVLLGPDPSEEQIAEGVSRFLRMANTAIDRCYARGLWLNGFGR